MRFLQIVMINFGRSKPIIMKFSHPNLSFRHLAALIILFFTGHLATFANADVVPVFITIGQSNADGSAMFNADIDAQMLAWYGSEANTGNLKIWYRSTQVENQQANALGEPARWVVDGAVTDVAPGWLNLWYRNENTAGRTAMNMIHGYGTYSTGSGTDCAQGRRGMEPAFGIQFAKAFPSSELYMIKLGVSGSQISTWANPLDNHNWDYFFEKVYIPAIDNLLAQGKTPVLAGIWWMQGCADAAYDQASYEKWLRVLIDKCRNSLGFPDAKFYVGHIVGPGENATYPQGSIQYSATVRAAQDAVGANVPGVVVVDTRDCQLQYEANFNGYLHYSHEGVNAIGRLLADMVIADRPNWAKYTGYKTTSHPSAVETPVTGAVAGIAPNIQASVSAASSGTNFYSTVAASANVPSASATTMATPSNIAMTADAAFAPAVAVVNNFIASSGLSNLSSFPLSSELSAASQADGCTEPLLLFEEYEAGSKFYRIPALVTAADGSLVLLADKRGDALGDLPNSISIVSKRSTDNGRTWSDMVMVAEANTSTGAKYGDPAVVLDRNSGDLVAVFCGDNGFWHYPSSSSTRQGIYVSRSSDNGLTWSAPTSISSQLNSVTWYGGFAGSGRMLQHSDGTIYFVFNARLKSAWEYSQVYEFVCASTDGGYTWSIRNPSVLYPSDGLGNESKLVELSDGSLLMSTRTPNPNMGRRFSRSTDGGRTWAAMTASADISESGCNGDIISYTTSSGTTLLLQSLPFDPAVRNQVGIYVSYDQGTTWKKAKQLCDSYSAYSSMTVLPDNTIGIVYEEGKWDSNIPGDDGFRLYYQNFTIDWLLEDTTEPDPEPDPDPEQPIQPTDPATPLAFDGVSQYMVIPNSDDFNIEAGGKMTVSIKVNLERTGTTGIIGNRVRDYSASNNNNVSGWQFYTAGTNTTVSYNYPGSSWNAKHNNADVVSTGVWHHLCWVYDGAKSTFYIDGNAVSTITGSASSIPSLADILVGAKFAMADQRTFSYDNIEAYLKGRVGDIRIYADALTDADVANDRGPSFLSDKNIVAAYDFATISGADVEDISGNGHTARLVNFPMSATSYILTITVPDANQGTLEVFDGTKKISSGAYVEEGTELTIVATPAQYMELDQILLNGTPLLGNTFTMDQAYTVSATFARSADAPVEYCQTTANVSNTTRYLTNFTMTTSSGASKTITGNGTADGRAVYKDATSEILVVKPGETVSTSATGNGWWAGEWVYVDWVGDGFNADEIRLNNDYSVIPGNDLVSFNSYSPDGENWYNSKGQITTGGVYTQTNTNAASALPSFTIPVWTAPGDYRARFILQFNSLNPCGNEGDGDRNNLDLIQRGGAVIDFILRVEAVQHHIDILTNPADGGNVLVSTDITSSQEPAGEIITSDGDVTGGTEIYLFVTPATDYILTDLVINNGEATIQLQDDELDFIAATNTYLYSFVVEGEVVVSATFYGDRVSITDIVDDISNGRVEIFNLNGIKVHATDIVPGIYILRTGNTIRKVLVK